jgi:hypothetical protein
MPGKKRSRTRGRNGTILFSNLVEKDRSPLEEVIIVDQTEGRRPDLESRDLTDQGRADSKVKRQRYKDYSSMSGTVDTWAAANTDNQRPHVATLDCKDHGNVSRVGRTLGSLKIIDLTCADDEGEDGSLPVSRIWLGENCLDSTHCVLNLKLPVENEHFGKISIVFDYEFKLFKGCISCENIEVLLTCSALKFIAIKTKSKINDFSNFFNLYNPRGRRKARQYIVLHFDNNFNIALDRLQALNPCLLFESISPEDSGEFLSEYSFLLLLMIIMIIMIYYHHHY